MQRHKWSQQDYDLLEKNVREHGLVLGSKKTAETLYLTENACKSMYWFKFQKFKKSGIKVDHPEIAKKAKVVEERKINRRCPAWTEEEIGLLKRNVEKYGYVEGSKRTSVVLDRTEWACLKKTNDLKHSGFEYKKLNRSRLSDKQEIELAEYLKTNIAKNPNNLAEVFRNAAKEFGFKSTGPIEFRWYGCKVNGTDYSKYPSCRKNIGHIYSVVGTNSTINGKNQVKPDVKKTGWILAIFKKWRNKNKK